MNENIKKQKKIQIFTPISNKQNITYTNYTSFSNSNKINKSKKVSFNDSSIKKLNLKQYLNSNKKDSITLSTINASNTLLSNNNTFFLNSNNNKNITNCSIIDSFNSTKDEIKTNKYKRSITNFSFNSISNEKTTRNKKLKTFIIKDKNYNLKTKLKLFIKDLEKDNKNQMKTINTKFDLNNSSKNKNLSFEKLLKQQKKN